MASKLGLYNAALREHGERKLASLSEDRLSRRALDECYDQAVRYCLEQGQWNFAIRTVEISSSPSLAPLFGYTYAFERPEENDWVRTTAFCSDDRFNVPLLDYDDTASVWYADIDPVYVKYVSDGADYGLDLSRWPSTFTRYVEMHLALLICKQVTNSNTDAETLKKDIKKIKIDALSKDAMNEPTKFPVRGSWVMSRGGGSISRNPSRA